MGNLHSFVFWIFLFPCYISWFDNREAVSLFFMAFLGFLGEVGLAAFSIWIPLSLFHAVYILPADTHN